MNTELVELKRTDGLGRDGLEFYEIYRKGEIATKITLGVILGFFPLMFTVFYSESNWPAFAYLGVLIVLALVAVKYGYDPWVGMVNYDELWVQQYKKTCELFGLTPQQFVRLTDNDRRHRAETIRTSLQAEKERIADLPTVRDIDHSLAILEKVAMRR